MSGTVCENSRIVNFFVKINPDVAPTGFSIELMTSPRARRVLSFLRRRDGRRFDLVVKALNSTWGNARVAQAMNSKVDIAALLLARFAGATLGCWKPFINSRCRASERKRSCLICSAKISSSSCDIQTPLTLSPAVY